MMKMLDITLIIAVMSFIVVTIPLAGSDELGIFDSKLPKLTPKDQTTATAQTGDGSINSTAWNRSGTDVILHHGGDNVGIGIDSPDGKTHIHTGSAGSVSADANSDELVVEGSGNTGLSILGTDASLTSIFYGHPADNRAADFQYDPITTTFIVGTSTPNGITNIRSGNGVIATTMDASQNVKIPTDNAKLFFGAGDDASITYNGSDMVFNPRETGAGNYVFKDGRVLTLGNGNYDGYISFANGRSEIGYDNGNNALMLQSGTAKDIGFRTGVASGFGGDSVVILKSGTGFFGIGEDSPTKKLDVRGEGNFSGTIYINNVTDVSQLGENKTFQENYTDTIYLTLNQTNFFDDGWIIYEESVRNFTFNTSQLSTKYYNATQSANLSGAIDEGTLSNTQHQDGNYDSVTLNFSESAGSPGLDIRMNFTNVTDFNGGVIRYKTSGLSGEFPIIQVWSYDDSVWEDYPLLSESSSSFSTITQPVYDTDEHLQNGIVQMRIYKASNGNVNNKYYVDWVAISKGYGTPAGEEVDPLSVHRDGSVELIGDWDYGAFNIDGSGNFTTTGKVRVGDDSDALESLHVNGAVMTSGSQTANTGSSAKMDWTSGGGRFITFGEDASTAGTYTLLQRSSDGSISRNVQVVDTGGNITFLSNVTADYFIGDGSMLTGITGDNASWNETRAYELYLNLSSEDDYLTTYNATYDGYALNVSINYTKQTYDTYDTRWNDGNLSFNKTYTDTLYADISSNALWETNGTSIYNSTALAFGMGEDEPVNMLDIEGGVAIRGAIFDGTKARENALFVDGGIDVGGTSGLGELDLYEATPNDESTIRLSNADTASGATDGFLISMYVDSLLKLWLYEAATMVFATNNTEALRIENSSLVNVTTNMSIQDSLSVGGYNPTMELDVRGSVNVSGELYVNNDTAVSTLGDNASWNESYASAKYVNVTGDTMTGDLIFNDLIEAKFGDAGDGTITYNKTDMIYDSRGVGLGNHIFEGGYVGVGISPISNLHVLGEMLIRGDAQIGGGTNNHDGEDEYLALEARSDIWYLAVSNEAVEQDTVFSLDLTVSNPTKFVMDGNGSLRLSNSSMATNSLLSVGGNVTATAYYGDGSKLTGVGGDNASWNESYADTLYSNATREFFIPSTAFSPEGETTGLGNFLVSSLSSSDDFNVNFQIPHDFTSLVGVYVVEIPDATETVQYDVATTFASAGEAYNTHTDSITDGQTAVTDEEIAELDISDAFTGISAGDYVGMEFASDTTNIKVIGIRMRYN